MPVLASRLQHRENISHGQYVYYKALNRQKDPFYQTLYTNRNSILDLQIKALINTTSIEENSASVIELRRMAEAELIKEQSFLNDMFGIAINYKPTDKDFYKNLINVFNEVVQFKSIFERNKDVLLNTNGQKGVFSYFDGYFIKAWEDLYKELEEKIPKGLENSGNEKIKGILEPIIDEHLEIVFKKSFEYMVKAKKEEGTKGAHIDAYGEFLTALDELDFTVNKFGSVFRDIFKIDEIKKLVTESITNTQLDPKILDARAISKAGTFFGQTGINMEAVYQFIISAALKTHLKNNAAQIWGLHTGQYQVKPDNIFGFNIDIELVRKLLEETSSNDRIDNIKAANKLSEIFKTAEKGYLIFTNDKNAKVSREMQDFNNSNSIKGFKGFSAGSPTSLRKLSEILELGGEAGASDLINICLQLGRGAIGNDNEDARNAVKRYISFNVAAFLFDDFATIGATTGGAEVIHLFNLNGNLIPLSAFLFKLSEAIQQGIQETEKIVSVSLHMARTIYTEDDWDPDKNKDKSTDSLWAKQKEDALLKSKISIKFLKGIRDFLT